MKIKFVLFLVFAAGMSVVLSSYKNGAAYNGSIDATGAEGTGVLATGGTAAAGCSTGNGCHNSTASLNTTIELDSAGFAVTTYHPGQAYVVKISATNNTGHNLPCFGFQLASVRLQGAGTSTCLPVGTWGPTFPRHTELVGVGTCLTCSNGLDIPVVEHTDTINATTGTGGAGTTYVELIPWNAPSPGTGSVKFYGVINGAQGDDNAAHNYYQQATPLTITEGFSTGISSISDKLSGFNVYPTLASENVTVAFDLKDASTVSITLISLQGQVVKTLVSGEGLGEGAFKRSFDVNGLATGVYLVRLQIGDASVVSKIVKD
jgi:hypothetical protein